VWIQQTGLTKANLFVSQSHCHAVFHSFCNGCEKSVKLRAGKKDLIVKLYTNKHVTEIMAYVGQALLNVALK
jgi:hypothetical protein